VKSRLLSPGSRLLAAFGFAILVLVSIMLLASRQPWLGLSLQWDEPNQAATVRASQGPSTQVAVGTQISTLRAPNKADIHFQAVDFIIEPDGNLPDYTHYHAFLERLDKLAKIQREPQLILVTDKGDEYKITPKAHRPLSSMPADFWVQLIVGLLAFIIAATVWSFRPNDNAARYLLLSGFATLMFAPGAAVYTTRELGIPVEEMLLLKAMNFGGGMLYVGTMVAMLWNYPRRLGSERIALLIVGFSLLWFMAQALGLFESMLIGRRLPVFIGLLLTIILAAVQWFNTQRDPVARASLQWFLLSWLLGTSLFIIITMVPQLYGVNTAGVQGYSFILFLLVYGGLAFGILRYRLFDLGEWWLRVVSWVGGLLLLMILDMILIWGLGLSSSLSFSLALILGGLIWLPLRGYIWSRVVEQKIIEKPIFQSVLDIAFNLNAEKQQQMWKSLLVKLFDPLLIKPSSNFYETATLIESGQKLYIPKLSLIPSFTLEYADGGRRLFTRRDEALASQLLEMLRHAESSRNAYQKGASEERSRIALDLHDDVGSRLLSSLHQDALDTTRDGIRQAIAEMRIIMNGLAGKSLPLSEIIADLRHETVFRLEAVKINTKWPVKEDLDGILLNYDTYRNYLSIIRELISNIIRHANANEVCVSIKYEKGIFLTELSDNGSWLLKDAGKDQHGLNNLNKRAEALNGSITFNFNNTQRGTLVTLLIPLNDHQSITGAS
jgi:two-component system sensor histidine kinase DevS